MYIMNEEVFVIFADYDTTVDIVVVKGLGEVLDHLKVLEPEEHYETQVLHGVFAPADVIPSDMLDNDCYLIVMVPGCSIDGIGIRGNVLETDCASNPSLLAAEIEGLINKNDRELLFKPNIEDVFVLYGYQTDLGLCINEDSLDEEKADSCRKVVNETMRIREGEVVL